MQLHIRLIFDTNRGDWISQRFLVVVKGHFVKLGTSIFAIESSLGRPGTALSLAFTLICVFLVIFVFVFKKRSNSVINI